MRSLDLKQLPFLEAEALWALLKIDPAFPRLRALAGLSDDHFNALYLPALREFSQRVQLAPASMSHHHAYTGGLLHHTIDVTEKALQLRQAFHLPTGADPEDINKLKHIYTYAVFAAALLHDAGKAIVNIHFVGADDKKHWNPLGQSFEHAGFTHYTLEHVYPPCVST